MHRSEVELSPILLRPFIGLVYQHWMLDGNGCGGNIGMSEWQGKPKYLQKSCPSDALSTADHILIDPDSNFGRRGGKPVVNCLSYGTV
jgi:hypothetical protein